MPLSTSSNTQSLPPQLLQEVVQKIESVPLDRWSYRYVKETPSRIEFSLDSRGPQDAHPELAFLIVFELNNPQPTLAIRTGHELTEKHKDLPAAVTGPELSELFDRLVQKIAAFKQQSGTQTGNQISGSLPSDMRS